MLEEVSSVVQTIILLDGKNCLFRFGFVSLNLQTSTGQYTGAIYGVLRCILRLKSKYPQSRFVVCWDGQGEGWRKKFWDGYKGNRTGEITSEVKIIRSQEGYLKKVMAACGIPVVEMDGTEADDLIGVLSTACLVKGVEPIIYSSDKDFYQLMCLGVKIIRDVDKGNKLAVETAATVKEQFRCELKDVLAVRAIAGDSSDGIPGAVRGIGPVTAAGYVRAGLDPSKEWCPKGCPEKLQAQWAAVHRNYRLMRVTRYLDDPKMWPGVRGLAEMSLLAQDVLGNGTPDKKRTYAELLELLGELELQEAMESRIELWQIQS